MTDLRLVAVTPERTHLVLEDDESKQFRVPIDERLANALRTERPRPGQLEITLESQLTPREIQARIRAGQNSAEVAAVAGVSETRIERYAVPVLAEREHIADLAKAAPSRRQSGGAAPSLDDHVSARLKERGVAADTIRWDAWRTDEHSWTVQLAYTEATREHVALWTFDPRGRVLAAVDDEARWLVDEARPARPEQSAKPTALRRLSSVPASAEEAAGLAADEVYDREADEAREAEQSHVAVDAGAAAQTAPAQSAAAQSGGTATSPRPARAARGNRRPVVPSWDDIMFGARRSD